MAITDAMVLPEDISLVPVSELPEEVRQQFEAEEGDFALTRPNTRTPSRILDAQSAKLLEEFRTPVTIVQAVLKYSRVNQTDPERTLEDAYPMLERLRQAKLLVPPDSTEAKKAEATLKSGDQFAEYTIEACMQSLEDTEVYRGKSKNGEKVALKLLRVSARNSNVAKMFEREAAILEKLGGEVGPRLVASGEEDGVRYLAIEWCAGRDCVSATREMRDARGIEARRRLLATCASIADGYARLHELNVVHSDVHPRNVLIDEQGRVKVIDFGLARISGVESEYRRAQRGGVAYFFEPEYAVAVRAGRPMPYSSMLGEQYSVAALIYLLLTGSHSKEFSLEQAEMMRQIAEDAPMAFAQRNVAAWPQVENVLAQAMEKDQRKRFGSMKEFAEALRKAGGGTEAEDGPRQAVTDGSAERAARDENVHRGATAASRYPEAEQMLARMLELAAADGAMFRDGLKEAPTASVNYGAAGIGYAVYRIACARQEPSLLALADLWTSRAERYAKNANAFYSDEIEITAEMVGRVSPHHTASGIYLVQALIAESMGDVLSQQIAIRQYIGAATAAPCENLDVTLGLSGVVLGAAQILRSAIKSTYVDTAELIALGNRTLTEIWEKLDQLPAVREGRTIDYSGAAHGWAGILYATMRWSRTAGVRLPTRFAERLAELAELAEPAGAGLRWKWSLVPRRNSKIGETMAGWCNGSAGFVYLWTLAHEMVGGQRFAELAERTAIDVWQTESNLGCLCCGYGGQAYALLNIYNASGDRDWLHKAQVLTERAARSTQMPAERYYQLAMRRESLYKGELGVAVLAAELARPEAAAMPFFES